MVSRAQFGALCCLLSLASGVRVARESKRGQNSAAIAGIFIRNYRDDAKDFVILFRKGTDEASIENSCKGRCHLSGTPSKGGFPFAAVQGKDRLAEVVAAHPETVHSLEVDDLEYIIPELDEGPATDVISAQTASWGLDAVNAPKASATGKGVHVYVQDTGIRATHQEFDGRVIPAIDLTGSILRECDGDLTCAHDRNGHGSHCAGTAGGKTFGVARDVTLHAVKTLPDGGGAMRSWQLSALDWITTKGQRPAVVSMSLGSLGKAEAYEAVIGAAVDAGITIVVAAGNFASDTCETSPAYVSQAITVGATDRRHARAGYSNFGPCNNIFAPGTYVRSVSELDDERFVDRSGTSMACPHVSGAAALILQNHPGSTSGQIMASFQHFGKKGFVTGLMTGDPDLFLNVEHF